MSWAVPPTVMLDADRVVLMLGDALFTVMPLWVPVIVLVAVSVAVIDWVPTVLSVTPLVKVHGSRRSPP